MPNLNQLVLSAAEYKTAFDVPVLNGPANQFVTYLLKTTAVLNYDIAVEDETVHAIGTILPIAEMQNAKSYAGTLEMQMGELNAILGLAGLNDATQLVGVTLGITAIKGAFARVFYYLNVNGERLQVRAKDKMTLVTMPWKAIGVNNA